MTLGSVNGIAGGSQGLDAQDPTWLVPVLNTLLPVNQEIPAAGDMGLAGAVLIDAQWMPDFTDSLHWLERGLPGGFSEADEPARVAALTVLEAEEPRRFADIVNLAYNAYYTDARVLALIERESNFTATPPQPLGYELEPFDPAILATVSKREPFWRRA